MSVFYLRGGEDKEPRKQSTTIEKKNPIPLEDLRIPLISIYIDEDALLQVRIANSVDDKLKLLEGGLGQEDLYDDILLVAWPGRTRQDVFVIDSPEEAIKYLSTKEEPVYR